MIMKINNAPITNSTVFLHKFFIASDVYSADIIDRDVDKSVIAVCLQNEMITEEYDKGKRLYRILSEGKSIIAK